MLVSLCCSLQIKDIGINELLWKLSIYL